MSDEIKMNRPQVQNQPAHNMQSEMPHRGGSKMPWVILGLVILVIVVLGILFRGSLFKSNNAMTKKSTTPSTEYQAVFLTNGQVYFGKISNTEENYVTLDNIYYLQVGPAQGSGTASENSSQNISLVKLGNELHGPVDEMHISRTQILFFEDLKNDGQVVKAIESYKANPPK